MGCQLIYMKKMFLLVAAAVAAWPWGLAAKEKPEVTTEWLALVHYRPQMFGGYEGTIDSESFYLAEDGRTNPISELQASIKLFEEAKDKEKICLFPARYQYLKKQGWVNADYPKCEEYQQFVKDLHPAGVTLLFTDAYMNNPSSLFGHTLVRIDTGRKGTQLLAHGMNYGAFTGPNPGALYAVLGLTGGYYGGFTVKPYYDTINTYNNIENRDIWELNLDLTQEEQEMFVAHLWEIGHTQTRYYFFSQNCSYMLLEMLDAVRPSLQLADEFPVQAIPLDTLKAVYRKPGLVKSVNYRPSRQAKIINQYKQMNELQKKAFVVAIKEQNYNFDGLDGAEKAGAAEAAYQYVQYQQVAGDLELSDYRQRSFKLLMARNNIKVKDNFSPLTNGEKPMNAHESKRLVVGAGVRNGQAFQEIQVRPAYHSLTDNGYGLLSGAEINFLNLKMRHYDNDDKYVLQDFDILGIKSLSPVNDMFMPYSYNIQWGINREINPESGDEGYVSNLVVGGGFTFEPWENTYWFVMLNNHAAYGGFLPHNQYLGLGAAVGMFADWGKWRVLAQAEQIWATTNYGCKIKYNAEVSYALAKDWALAAEYKYEQNRGKYDVDEGMLGLRYYF